MYPRENLRRAMALYAVTDRAWLGERTLSACVEEALAGGATFVQLREKDAPQAEVVLRARARSTTSAWGASFSRSCTNVAPPASASSTHAESVRSPSHARSVTAYSAIARRRFSRGYMRSSLC